ncbi:HlyD family efflux transporter periplasmic adaptor subunit [Oscillospiraceae bacterium NTUH-002-81]|nr:HlyD family efflux transporter periplasmic adaptor subunit [Oscillospiraceae bacterium NTUH-002-81]
MAANQRQRRTYSQARSRDGRRNRRSRNRSERERRDRSRQIAYDDRYEDRYRQPRRRRESEEGRADRRRNRDAYDERYVRSRRGRNTYDEQYRRERREEGRYRDRYDRNRYENSYDRRQRSDDYGNGSGQRRRPRPRKVAKYRRPLPVKTGMLIFSLIFLCMLYYVYAYFSSTRISPYEVQAGSIVVDNTCEGLAIRQEDIVYADGSGYISYYARAGERVAGSSNVYTLDETGQVINTLTASLDGEALDADSLNSLKTSMEAYESSISRTSFSQVYDFKSRMENQILSVMNDRLIAQADALEEETGGTFNFVKATEAGIIEFYTDGYEGVTKDTFTNDMLDSTSYEKRDLSQADIVNAGDPVYKLVTDETWNIIIPLDDEKLEALADKSSVSIRFLKNNLETTAGIEIMRRDGLAYGVLSLSNYMVDFAEDRYVQVELKLSQIEGLKIPATAIIEKQFYTIPVGYVTTGGDDDSDGFLRETYMEDGSTSTVFVPTTIYETTDEVYYVDCNDFSPGDYIVKPDSEERYQIGTTASLKGVYNINRGYAVFRKVNILYESGEYCIVEQGSTYGLSIYDHIVLDSKAVKEEEIIY